VRTTTEHRTATVTHTVDGRERVPGVTGRSLSEAKGTLENAGFRVDVVSDSLFGIVNEDNWVVVQQEPRAGERLASGQTVTLTVQRR
jgi:beta-lactam-binding protein with PASTA domain